MSEHDRIRIDDLNPTDNPSEGHELPAMHEGQTHKLTVAQIAAIARLFDGSESDFSFSSEELGAALRELGTALEALDQNTTDAFNTLGADDVGFDNTAAQLPGSPEDVQAAIEAFLSSGRLRPAIALPGQVIKTAFHTSTTDMTTSSVSPVEVFDGAFQPLRDNSVIRVVFSTPRARVGALDTTGARSGEYTLREKTTDTVVVRPIVGRNTSSSSAARLSFLGGVHVGLFTASSLDALSFALEVNVLSSDTEWEARGDESGGTLLMVIEEIAQ